VPERIAVVVALAAICLALRAAGPFALAARGVPDALGRRLDACVPALLGALVAAQALTSGRHLAIDARVVGVGAALVAIARRAPLVLVLLAAAVATAGVRLL
jgi:branched-subunit amino acid transport protein